MTESEKRTLRTVTTRAWGQLEIEEKASAYRFARRGWIVVAGLKNCDVASITDVGQTALLLPSTSMF
jgi:hypothetical protein